MLPFMLGVVVGAFLGVVSLIALFIALIRAALQ